MTPVWGLFLFVPESRRERRLSELSEWIGVDRSGSEWIGGIGVIGGLGAYRSNRRGSELSE